jgi:hypothetical protein
VCQKAKKKEKKNNRENRANDHACLHASNVANYSDDALLPWHKVNSCNLQPLQIAAVSYFCKQLENNSSNSIEM